MGNRKSDHSNWVLTGPHEADRAQPPFVEAGHLPHKIGPTRAKIQKGTITPKAAWGRIASQDPEHLPLRFRRQVLLLKPHVVFVPRKVPHPTGVALKRSNAALEELLHHLGRYHVEHPQTLEAVPDEGKTGARELLITPA